MKKLYAFIKQTIIVSLFCTPSVLQATHIVGGEFTYKFVKRDSADHKLIYYNFNLNIYRETASAAGFDYRPSISIFIKQPNGSYKFVRRINPYLDEDNIRPVQPPKLPCTETPSGIGVEIGTYNWTEVLRDTNTSYLLAYQRCCRNNSIFNIWSAASTGTTYYVEITPEAQRANNSSPTFQELPPIFICGNEPINYNHSAIDRDGHQLVYRFCPAFEGGTTAQPAPLQASTPPFTPVTYIVPTYNANAPMGGSPIVKIDPNTGIITGTPTDIGQFVVTVCVEEYENGILLSRIFRDFQFNVVSCRRLVVSKLDADSVFGKKFSLYGCDTTTLALNNTSYDRANINNFYWEFNKNGRTTRYTDWSPVITFRDTGIYTGKLVLNPGEECSDSAFVEVNIGGRLNPSIAVQYDACVAGPVQFKGSVANNIPLSKIVWLYGDFFKDSNDLVTNHQYTYAGTFTCELFVKDQFGCMGHTSKTFTWQPAPPILIVEPSAFVGCVPSEVFFKNNSTPIDATYKVAWDFGDGVLSNEISPKHIYTQADTFTVKLLITSPIGCKKEAIFKDWIKIKPVPKADFDWTPKTINNLHPSVSFIDKSSSDTKSWRWYFSQKAYSNQQNPPFSYRDTGIQTVQLYVTNQYGCQDSITKTIYIEPEMTFYLPTAFSPNYDSVNDVFKGTGFLYGLKSYRMTIWNRWGEKIFETTNPQEGWNGQKNNIGQSVPEGIYLCEVEYITPKNEKKRLNNFLTLYR
ncbi:MAG: gliding motility-associated C-terminal domain-containing protein [Saprospiraceae bacterium]|nr:gliding motility-associated C-terminal domain-containing protein [Saprospiraceae bacterium]